MIKEYSILRSIEKSLLKTVSLEKRRELFENILWKDHAISIYGERGVGKTYGLLQERKRKGDGLYFSADSHFISGIGLFEFVVFAQKNYSLPVFYIDEIHAYPNWIQEVKNCIDSFPDVQFVFTGSSSMMLQKGSIDLGRRIRDYRIHPLSFREYLSFFHDISVPSYPLKEIIQSYPQIIAECNNVTRLQFQDYLKRGFYPYSRDCDWGGFVNRLNKLLDKAIQEDMIGFFNFTRLTASKLQKLFYFLANTTPSEISIHKLAHKIGTNKDLLGEVLYVLNAIGVVRLVEKYGKISETIRKHQKIFLGNPNIYMASSSDSNVGTIRESYFLSQMAMADLRTMYIKDGDYAVIDADTTWFFEIGGKGKSPRQLQKKKNAFVAVDDFYGGEKKIPLWLFGLLS